tara:strand:- start:6100 stop:6501 length:402 start_codon:yes stop_codon:yes gene_type:complete
MKKKKVDPDKVRMLASFGCKYIDIGKYFEVSEAYIRREFKEQYGAGREDMKFKLRRAMWTSAMENNSIAMQIFMAKNYLGMSDKTAVDMTTNLQSVLQACGFEENPLDKANNEQEKAMEDFGLPTDSTAVGRS